MNIGCDARCLFASSWLARLATRASQAKKISFLCIIHYCCHPHHKQ
jgi:hypothetical protein